MIDFACKTIKIEEIIKCSLNLSKAEYKILKHFTKNDDKWLTTQEIADTLNLNLSTIQKATKKLNDKKIIKKTQKNLDKGGYIFEYQINNKEEVKEIVLNTVKEWTKKVEDKICKW